MLDAALDLFSDRGFGNTSIDLICQTAYVSTRSFYQLFDSREDCFLALYERTASEYKATMRAAESIEYADEKTRIQSLLQGYVDMIVSDRRKALVAFSASRTVSDAVERARRDTRAWTADFVEALWTSQGRSIPPRRVTAALVAGIFEVIVDHLTDPPEGSDSDGPPQALVTDLLHFYNALRSGLDANTE